MSETLWFWGAYGWMVGVGLFAVAVAQHVVM